MLNPRAVQLCHSIEIYHASSVPHSFRVCLKSTRGSCSPVYCCQARCSWPLSRFFRAGLLQLWHQQPWGQDPCEGGYGYLDGMGRGMPNSGVFLIFQKLHFCWLFICLCTQTFPCGIRNGWQSCHFSRQVGRKKMVASSAICYPVMLRSSRMKKSEFP